MNGFWPSTLDLSSCVISRCLQGFVRYPPVNKQSNGKSPSWIGNTSSNGGFSIAMLDYRRVRLMFITTRFSLPPRIPRLNTQQSFKANSDASTPHYLFHPNMTIYIIYICYARKKHPNILNNTRQHPVPFGMYQSHMKLMPLYLLAENYLGINITAASKHDDRHVVWQV